MSPDCAGGGGAANSQGKKSQDDRMRDRRRRQRRTARATAVHLVRDQAQRHQQAQQHDPIRHGRRELLDPRLLRPGRHAPQPGVHDLDAHDDDAAAEVRAQHGQLPRDGEGEEHDRGRVVRAVRDEDDEGRHRQDERDAPRAERRVDAGREGARGRAGGEAAEQQRRRLFFVVVVVVRRRDGGALVVGQQWRS